LKQAKTSNDDYIQEDHGIER